MSGDPLIGFNFQLDIQGQVAGYFTTVSGLGSETEVTEHKIVGDGGNQIVRKVPGRLIWGDIELGRGVTASMDIWKWRKLVEDGNVADARANGSIVMNDQTGSEIARFNFTGAWPSKVMSGDLSTEDAGVVIESMTIVHEYIERVT